MGLIDLATTAYRGARDALRDSQVDDVEPLDRAMPHPGDVERAKTIRPSNEGPTFAEAVPDLVGLLDDPYEWFSGAGEYHERPTALTWELLRAMANSTLIAPIINRLVSEVAEFTRPEENPYLPGFAIRMRDRKREPGRAALRMIGEIERFVCQCGVMTDMRQAQVRPDFESFTRMVMRDSLVYDWAPFQVVPNRFGRPARMVAMPGHTIRVAHCVDDRMRVDEAALEAIRYVQVFEETVVAEFPASRLAVGVRNPRTELDVRGYGHSELEMIPVALNAWLGAFGYNSRQFSQGLAVRGLLNVKGATAGSMLAAFKRDLKALVMGHHNAGRMPVIGADGLEYVDLRNSNRDMEFHQWLDFLIKLICAYYGVDPAAINFVYGNTGQSSAMGSVSAEERVQLSRDRALRPLVRQYFGWINRWVIWQLDSDFELVATGLGGRSEIQQQEIDVKAAGSYMTVDEVRARRDLPPLPDGSGEVILNQTWLQAKQGAAVGGDDGGAEPGDDAGDDAPGVGALFGAGDDDGDDDDDEPSADPSFERGLRFPTTSIPLPSGPGRTSGTRGRRHGPTWSAAFDL